MSEPVRPAARGGAVMGRITCLLIGHYWYPAVPDEFPARCLLCRRERLAKKEGK